MQADQKLHITGKGYLSRLVKIIGLEDAQEYKNRKELSEPVTKYVTKQIMNDQSRWKTAQGTTKFYDFGEKKELSEQFRKDILDQAWKNKDMNRFIHGFWRKALYTDFMGFCLVEQEQVIQDENRNIFRAIRDNVMRVMGRKETKGKPYIVFKALWEIVDYVSSDTTIEYLIMNFGSKSNSKTGNKTDKVDFFRVIDDAQDRIFEKRGDKITLSTEFAPLKNELGYVPAIQLSTFFLNPVIDEIKTSPIDEVLPLLNMFLTQYSEHVMSAILHSHPIYYQVGMRCLNQDDKGNACNGGRIYDGTTGKDKKSGIVCPACQGSGSTTKKSSSTVITLPAKTTEGEPFNITNVAGYVTPDVESLKQQIEELEQLERKIRSTTTGERALVRDDISRTATEVMVNVRPLEDIINDVLDNLEQVETFLVDAMGTLAFPTAFKGSFIHYGRQLNLRGENAIVKELGEAKKNGASQSYITGLMEELIRSKYEKSPVLLERNVLLLNLEPLPGYTFDEAEKAVFVDDAIKKMKQNFSDYINRFELANGPIQDFEEGKELNERVILIGKELDLFNSSTIFTEEVAESDTESSSDTT